MGADNEKVSLETGEAMFDHWAKHQNMVKTAEAFNYARSTLMRLADRENWQERYDKVKGRVQKATETDITNVIKGNLEYVRAVKRKLLLTILGKTELEGTISELIKLMEYEDKLLNIFPADSTAGQTNNFIVQIINGLNDTEKHRLDANLRSYFGNGLYRQNGGGGAIDPIRIAETESGPVSPQNGEESNSQLH